MRAAVPMPFSGIMNERTRRVKSGLEDCGQRTDGQREGRRDVIIVVVGNNIGRNEMEQNK